MDRRLYETSSKFHITKDLDNFGRAVENMKKNPLDIIGTDGKDI